MYVNRRQQYPEPRLSTPVLVPCTDDAVRSMVQLDIRKRAFAVSGKVGGGKEKKVKKSISSERLDRPKATETNLKKEKKKKEKKNAVNDINFCCISVVVFCCFLISLFYNLCVRIMQKLG